MTVFLLLLSRFCATLFTPLALTGLVTLNLTAWTNANFVSLPASSLLMVTLLFALHLSYRYVVETKARRQIAKPFGQYLPLALVNEMSRLPEAQSIVGDHR